MDGMNPIYAVGLNRPQPREAPRVSGRVRGAVLMAVIAAATFMTILALDYAGIQLPMDSEPLTWPLG